MAKRHETHLQKLLLHDDQDRSVKSLSDEKKISEDHYNDGNHPIQGTSVQYRLKIRENWIDSFEVHCEQ